MKATAQVGIAQQRQKGGAVSRFGIPLLILFFLWIGYRGLSPLLKSPPKDANFNGVWVGTVETSTYYGPGLGERHAFHKKGVLYVDLSQYDSYLNKYAGEGELALDGDRPRKIHVGRLWEPNEGQPRVSGLINGDFVVPGPSTDLEFEAGRNFDGDSSNGVLRIQCDIGGGIPGLAFNAVLRKGTLQQYQTLKSSQQSK